MPLKTDDPDDLSSSPLGPFGYFMEAKDSKEEMEEADTEFEAVPLEWATGRCIIKSLSEIFWRCLKIYHLSGPLFP